VSGVFLTSSASVRLWNERVGVPPPDRIFQIPYFMPALPRADEVEAPASPGDSGLRVLFVGAQARRKNLPRLVEACGMLARRSRRVVLTVVSDFRDGEVDTTAPFIRSLGRRGNAEVFGLLRESHVLCVPSLWESFGMIYVEALAHGCAVVAPDREVQRSLFGSAAQFCDPENPESIAAAIERAAAEASRRELVSRGIALYRARFAPDVVASTMVEAALTIAA
jgi:glycosyltransferase involved in cell wall biosynthesis